MARRRRYLNGIGRERNAKRMNREFGITKKHRVSNWSLLVLIQACLMLVVAGCEQTESDEKEDDAAQQDAGSKVIDALTTATPGVKSALRSKSHSGWKNPDCFSCHLTVHAGGYRLPECSLCHGVNGAPTRTSGHADTGCRDCHSDAHAKLGFSAPTDCRSCHVYESTDGCAHSESYDVVVIGAGGGGLSAAAYLAKAGLRVVLLEQNNKLGGNMGRFKRGDYNFESSLHAYDGMGLQIFPDLGIDGRVEVLTSDIMYKSIYPDFEIEVPADVQAYKTLLKKRFPDQAAGIDTFFDTMTGFHFDRVAGMSLSQAMENQGITDKKLAAVLSQLAGFLAGGPDVLPAQLFVGMYSSYHSFGYHYFTGGSQAIVDALAAVIEENNGVIRTRTLATRIVPDGDRVSRVITEQGGCYDARYVISNISPRDTYLKLIGEKELDSALVEKVKAIQPAPSFIAMIYLGVDHDYTDHFPANTHEIFVNPYYGMDAEQSSSRACQPEKTGFGIANYSVVDSTAAPPGKNAIVITAAFMGYSCNDEWQFASSYKSYTDYKKEIAEAYIQQAEQFLPGLSKHIEVLEVASPHTVEQYTLNPSGSWAGQDIAQMGLASGGFHSAEEQMSPFNNLFLSGAWVSGCGESMVLRSGISAGKLVMAAEPQP
jgi:all-trans-retinol 13,14-reductase